MNQNTKALLRSLTTALVCVAIVFAFLISGIRLFGYQVYGVLTGSMVPAYPIGSLIYVQETRPEDLELRDVITFSSGKTIVTHRIVEIVRDENNPMQLRFRTKGDANNDPDASLVGPADIIGKVAFGIPHLGTIANYIQNPPGLYVTIFIGLALIGLVIFMDTDDNKKGEGNNQPAKQPNMPWLTNLLAKVGVTWPKPQEPEQPAYPGYQPQQMQLPPQQYMQQMPQQIPQGYPQQQYPQQYQQMPQYPQQMQSPQQMQLPPQQYVQQMPQQIPQGYPQQQYPQQYQQMPQYPQQVPPQYQQGYPQQYQQMPQQPQYPQQGYPQQYGAPLERPKNPLE